MTFTGMNYFILLQVDYFLIKDIFLSVDSFIKMQTYHYAQVIHSQITSPVLLQIKSHR